MLGVLNTLGLWDRWAATILEFWGSNTVYSTIQRIYVRLLLIHDNR